MYEKKREIDFRRLLHATESHVHGALSSMPPGDPNFSREISRVMVVSTHGLAAWIIVGALKEGLALAVRDHLFCFVCELPYIPAAYSCMRIMSWWRLYIQQLALSYE